MRLCKRTSIDEPSCDTDAQSAAMSFPKCDELPVVALRRNRSVTISVRARRRHRPLREKLREQAERRDKGRLPPALTHGTQHIRRSALLTRAHCAFRDLLLDGFRRQCARARSSRVFTMLAARTISFGFRRRAFTP
jgi:hypothetical protein